MALMEFDADHILCFNCGFISKEDQWTYWINDDEGNSRIPAPEGFMDPALRCPVCAWFHTDDDSNPGIFPGPYYACIVERQNAEEDWNEIWSDTAADLFSL